ncbi:hypothetical protein [Pseudomonas putida]|uniref:Uncharacterized protein n=1 Tax=Pseudomonas putida TaxID=303 RepID=A0A1Q9QV16_PSEPU|nr:hypothetical protein [Pseudomonas putida]OLS58989.1 hypothetical protein PSEMO_59490 [Pseudomonas putida]
MSKDETKTDWDRLASMKDEDIDFSDIPELDDDFFRSSQLLHPCMEAQIALQEEKEPSK